MLTFITVLVVVLIVIWAVGHFYLEGEDLSRYDRVQAPPVGSLADGQREPSTEHHEVLEFLTKLTNAGQGQRGQV